MGQLDDVKPTESRKASMRSEKRLTIRAVAFFILSIAVATYCAHQWLDFPERLLGLIAEAYAEKGPGAARRWLGVGAYLLILGVIGVYTWLVSMIVLIVVPKTVAVWIGMLPDAYRQAMDQESEK